MSGLTVGARVRATKRLQAYSGDAREAGELGVVVAVDDSENRPYFVRWDADGWMRTGGRYWASAAELERVGAYKDGETIRYTNGNCKARITYSPTWSPNAPWTSYIDGTAGRHFPTTGNADIYMQSRGFKRA